MQTNKWDAPLKKEVGERIKQFRIEHQNQTQKAFVDDLKEKYRIASMDHTQLSRIENGEYPSQDLYIKICNALSIKIPILIDERLRVGFSQGFWAAPLVLMNEERDKSFFKQVTLSSYSDAATDEPIFSEKGSKLLPFDAEKHAFYYSGEIVELVQSGKIDVGFLGNTVLDNKNDLIRVGRLVNADSTRHGMLMIAPKGTFPNQEAMLTYLIDPPKTLQEPCYIYYHPKSTSEVEFRDLLQHAGHWHNTLPTLHLPTFRAEFAEKIKKHPNCIIGHIGLMLTIETAKNAIPEPEKYDIFVFRTNDILALARKLGISNVKPNEFFYEMIVSRQNEVIKKLANEHDGFRLLLKYLRENILRLKLDRNGAGIPLSHRKVAEFFGLDLQQASEMLKKTEFELVFYPEWVNKILGIVGE
jgi:transcriptional regulator with XRE-family HTH domain